MKCLIFAFVIFISCSGCNGSKKISCDLTFDNVQSVIEPLKETVFYTSLNGLIQSWHGQALKEGKSECEAVQITLDKLSNTLLELGK